MTTAEHYLTRWRDKEFELHELIEQTQKEAHNEAIEEVAEKATLSLFDWTNGEFKEFKQNSNHYSINDGTYVKIDEQSILKLKK